MQITSIFLMLPLCRVKSAHSANRYYICNSRCAFADEEAVHDVVEVLVGPYLLLLAIKSKHFG